MLRTKTHDIHVLIVDDEKSICDILSQYLRKVGYRTTVARSGEDALEKIGTGDVDMVLTDIKMPGMSGVDLLKQIKSENLPIPVLLTTGFPTLDTAIEALKLGAFDYLTKPFHLEEIGEKIKRALASKRLEEENHLFSNLVALHEVTTLLISTRDLPELHRQALQNCVKLCNADGGSMMLLDAASRLAVYETVGDGFAAELWDDLYFTEIGMSAIASGEPRVLPGLEGDARFSSSEVSSIIASHISFPLTTSKRAIGVVNLVRRAGQSQFLDLDLEIVKVLSSQAGIAIENLRLYENIRDNYLKTVRGFALAVEAKDRYTHGHSEKVMKYTMVLARRLDLSDAEIEHVKYAGLLHDIGKIGIPEGILNKPGRLTPEEFEEIKKHPELGVRIIADVPFLQQLSPLILYHHEYYDGSGYPAGLKGEEIPFGARILGVCDAFDAMTSDRPYRKAMSDEQALGILLENKDRQFDPAIVDAFVGVMSEKHDE